MVSKNDFLTIDEVCEILKLSKWTIYKRIKSGKIKAVNIGSEQRPNYRFDRQAIERILRGE